MRKKRGRLVGRATAGAAVCSSSVELALMRKKAGRDQKLLVVRARASGRFRTRAPRLAGRYYVVLKERYVPGSAECGGSRSKAVRIRR